MSGWKYAPLAEVADIERDSVAPSAIRNGTLYVGLENIQTGGEFLNVHEVDEGELASNKFAFTDEHLLYGKLRPYLAKIARPSFSGICSTDILPIKPGPQLSRDYLSHFLLQPSMVDFANSRAAGANLPRLSPRVLATFSIPLPPLPEQRRIAAILDQADTLRTQRRAALAQLDSLTQSLFLDMFGDPVTNPYGFEACVLGDIIEFVGGAQPAKEYFVYEASLDTVRLVQIRDFRTDEFKTYIPKALARRTFEVDDVMIGRYGPPVFQIFRGLSGSYNVALMKALPKAGVLRDFIFLLLQEKGLHGYVVDRSTRTAGQSGVNLELLENYPAYRPPFPLQQTFATRVQAIETLKATHRAALAEADALFAALQQRAFAGGL